MGDAAPVGGGAGRLRLARGLARDGADLEPAWQRWLVTEAAEFAREHTRARADLRVDGTSPTGDALVLV